METISTKNAFGNFVGKNSGSMDDRPVGITKNTAKKTTHTRLNLIFPSSNFESNLFSELIALKLKLSVVLPIFIRDIIPLF